MITNKQITDRIRVLMGDARYIYNTIGIIGNGFLTVIHGETMAVRFHVDRRSAFPRMSVKTYAGRELTTGDLKEERDIERVLAQAVTIAQSLQRSGDDLPTISPDPDALRYQRRHPGGKKEKAYRNNNRYRRNSQGYRRADKFGTHYALQYHDLLTLGKAPRIEIEDLSAAPTLAEIMILNPSVLLPSYNELVEGSLMKEEGDLTFLSVEGAVSVIAPKPARPARTLEHRRRPHISFFAPLERRSDSRDDIRVSPAVIVEQRYGRQKGPFSETQRKFIKLLYGRNDKRAIA
jgi:hypothetical protein